jgi:L-iditol 2-dehydrogenase
MKALVLKGKRHFELDDIAPPVLNNDNDVLIRVGAVGICGSDIHYYSEGKIGDQRVQYPFIIGHECTGIVEQIGDDVTHVKPGDRIAIDPAVSCGTCEQCSQKRPHTCENLRFLGHPGQLSGCLSEYILMPQENCYFLKDNITLKQGVLVEPLSIGIYAARFINTTNSKKIGVFGVGPIGISVLTAIQELKINSIYITDRIDHRLNVAQNAGAQWTGNPDTSDIVKEIKEKEPHLLDAVFECCGEQEAINQAIELLKPGGKLIIVGIPTVDRINIDIHTLRRKEISIINVRRQNNCIGEAIEYISNYDGRLDFMLTHTFSLQQAKEAFDMVEGYNDGVIKGVIEFV